MASAPFCVNDPQYYCSPDSVATAALRTAAHLPVLQRGWIAQTAAKKTQTKGRLNLARTPELAYCLSYRYP
jgi:hypothetical protein